MHYSAKVFIEIDSLEESKAVGQKRETVTTCYAVACKIIYLLSTMSSIVSTLSSPSSDEIEDQERNQNHPRRPHEPLVRSMSDMGFARQNSFFPASVVPPRPGPSRPQPQRTISLNLNSNVISTEREPMLLDEKLNTIYVQGRPPWFCKDGALNKEPPFIIGIR